MSGPLEIYPRSSELQIAKEVLRDSPSLFASLATLSSLRNVRNGTYFHRALAAVVRQNSVGSSKCGAGPALGAALPLF